MGATVKYLYGIIDSNSERFFGRGGIVVCEDVYTVSYHDISALVSNSVIADYTYMPKDALARQLVRHQKVIERIMTLGYPIIPIRLGTFTSDENEVRDILDKGYGLIKEVFSKITGKTEIDLVAIWSDFNSLLKEVGERREIMEFKEELLAHPKGITAEDRMRIGAMIKKALDEERERCRLEIQDYLRDCYQALKIQEVMDDKVVINTAFLINKAGQEEFDRKIEELNNKFSERLNFRYVGPLPPYSFYTLEVKRIRFDEIDAARKKLGLDDLATKDEIKKGYKRKVLSSHPDKNQNMPGVEQEFGEVNRAYKILIDYCKACEQAGQVDKYPFKEEEIKENAILVKVRE